MTAGAAFLLDDGEGIAALFPHALVVGEGTVIDELLDIVDFLGDLFALVSQIVDLVEPVETDEQVKIGGWHSGEALVGAQRTVFLFRYRPEI